MLPVLRLTSKSYPKEYFDAGVKKKWKSIKFPRVPAHSFHRSHINLVPWPQLRHGINGFVIISLIVQRTAFHVGMFGKGSDFNVR